MDAKSDIPSQKLQGRDALASVFDNLNQYVATTHFNGHSTVVLGGTEATGVSYCLAHHVSVRGSERSLMIASIAILIGSRRSIVSGISHEEDFSWTG
jgi:hypothetical protein